MMSNYQTQKEMIDATKEMTNDPDFFVYYVVDYYATGEGRSVFLFVERNYDKKESFKEVVNWVGAFYAKGIEELTEEQFFIKYEDYIPNKIRRVLLEKNVPNMVFKQEHNLNYEQGLRDYLDISSQSNAPYTYSELVFAVIAKVISQGVLVNLFRSN